MSFLHRVSRKFEILRGGWNWEDPRLILAARALMESDGWALPPKTYDDPYWIQEKEFRVYSQFGDDGIIQWLIQHLQLNREGKFIEFGVGDYFESNTHFLLVNDGWSGYVLDGSRYNVDTIEQSSIYWRYNLRAECQFITIENINRILENSNFRKVELLHIDLDGNDYWVLEVIDLDRYQPDILILEYNSLFGCDRLISVPYDPHFVRTRRHFSGKYFGASLAALDHLARKKGYYFIGCNSAGNNSYYLHSKYRDVIPEVSIRSGFQESRFREARGARGELLYLDRASEASLIAGLPVVNVVDGTSEAF